MCTVSWVREAGQGYILCVSRDERRSREPGVAPAVDRLDGVTFLAPRDGDKGGSWLAVNEHGTSVCLLNRYDVSGNRPLSNRRSRGEIVTYLASSRDCDEAARRLLRVNLSCFAPFVVVCIEPYRPALILDWTGDALTGDFQAEGRMPLVSSSLFPAEAKRARRELLERLRQNGLTKETLLEFHASHEPERGPLSPCMHREDAATVSFSVVEVSALSVRMIYQQGAPCENGAVSTANIARGTRRDVNAA